MNWSIRVRLLCWMSVSMALLLTVFAVVVYEVMSRSLVNGFDEVLASTVRTIHGSVEQERDGVKIEIDERELPEFYRATRPDYFQLWREDGGTVARSPSLKGADLERIATPLDLLSFRPIRLPDGRAGRAVYLFFKPKVDEDVKDAGPSQKLTLTVARETAALDSQIRLLQVVLGATTGGTIILALLVSTVLVRRGLQPLSVVASRIGAIGHDDLSTRIEVKTLPAEVEPVVQRLNDLLQRLDEAFCRERAFTADAAHELRTPLAGLRSILEVALARPRVSEDYRHAMTDCLDIVQRTHAMIDNLLALARLDSGQASLHLQSLCLAELIETALRPLANRIQARGISVEKRVSVDIVCITDRDSLFATLTILFTNAVEYTNDEGRIEVAADQTDGSLELTLANTGCRLSAEDARRVFERFWRSDISRTDTGIHCGLGLPLAQRIVTSLGGAITANATGDIFLVRILLPATPIHLKG